MHMCQPLEVHDPTFNEHIMMCIVSALSIGGCVVVQGYLP
jgi:hypothetical protein